MPATYPLRLIAPLALLAAGGLAACTPATNAPARSGPQVGQYEDGTPVNAAPRTAGSVQTSATADAGAPLPTPAAAGAAATGAGGRLGTTVVSLGAAGEAGAWLKTPLVKARTNGRVVNAETGQSAQVVLLPLGGGGSGSQASLATMQAIGAELTDLPTVEVFAS